MKGAWVAVVLAAGCNGFGTFPRAKAKPPTATATVTVTAPTSAPPAAAPPSPPPPPAPLDPEYTLFLDAADLAATNQGAAWCSDGTTPDVRVTVALGLVRATTGAAPGLEASFGAPLVSATEGDFADGFALAVEASCAGQPFFTAGSAQVMPTRGDIEYGALELDMVGAVDRLRLHFTLGYAGGGSGGGGGGDDTSDGGSDPGWAGNTGGSGADWANSGGSGDTGAGTVDTGGAIASGDDSGSSVSDGAGSAASDDTSSADDGGDGSGTWTDTTGYDCGCSNDATSGDSGSTADDGSSSDDGGGGDSSDPIDDFARRPHHAIKRVAKRRR
jgi:hypothetical protein